MTEPRPASDEVLQVTPEVMLFVGGAVLSVALIAVMLYFWMRISKQESAADRAGRKGGA